MKTKINNRILAILLVTLLVALVTACGSSDNTDVIASVEWENVSMAPEKIEESTKKVDSDATYVEYNGLEFTEDTEATIQGTLYVGNDVSTLKVIDVNWEITNITISEAEDGFQTIIIEQESHGYFCVDDTGNIFATNLNIPVGRLCDMWTGQMIPVGETTEIECKDNIYSISVTEAVLWEDGDWSTDWIPDPEGGERLPSTLKVRTTIEITNGYTGLGLILVPITDADGSVYGEKILDAWMEGSYLFDVSELSSKFDNAGEEGEDITDAEVVAEATVIPTPTATATEKTTEEGEKGVEATPQPTETPKPAESTPQPTQKPVHVHQYSSKVTAQPNCVNTGTRLYSCECGDSYTESINATGHDYSVPITQTVHHDEQYEAVRREIPGYRIYICRQCKGEFDTFTDLENHLLEDCSIWAAWDEWSHPASYTYDYVLTTPAYDEEVIVGYKCSVCNQQK